MAFEFVDVSEVHNALPLKHKKWVLDIQWVLMWDYVVV